MTSFSYQPWLHRFAVLTAAATLLLTIAMGAQVTTTGAGMAFPDWPSSDGHNLFLYPWLKSQGDKFLEHGHRLAGSLIGMLSIGLAGWLWWKEPRRWVRLLGVAVLLGVIVQGVLGGQRVLLDARGLAFLHGVFASWVFGLMVSVVVVTSRGWFEAERLPPAQFKSWWAWSAAVTAVLVVVQYILGALLRHHGAVLYEHAGFAVLVLAGAVCTALAAAQSGTGWLRRAAALLVLLAVLQIGLGLATYVVKFGFGGYVPQYGSALQAGIRTAHVLLGMLVWAAAVTTALRAWRLRTRIAAERRRAPQTAELGNRLAVRGGAT